MAEWHIYRDTKEPHDRIDQLPPPPKWRNFRGRVIKQQKIQEYQTDEREKERALSFEVGPEETELVNAALYLRRPLLITGKPGVGKSSLAYSVAFQLNLGRVLYWPITTRSTVEEGLYRYDAVGRFQDLQVHFQELQIAGIKGNDCDFHKKIRSVPDIGHYIRLGPLGTALLPSERPKVLLIDEIDKSDIDLPNNLLNIFEEGEFEIPEISRLYSDSDFDKNIEILPSDSNERIPVQRGRVMCKAFPFIVLTSNGERELPVPFLRRCIQMKIEQPSPEKLKRIVESHFENTTEDTKRLIETFLERREKGPLATDQLLNAIYLRRNGIEISSKENLINAVLKTLDAMETP
ncbi:MAG: AAA family ATPase [Desulfococcaceae bacterium]